MAQKFPNQKYKYNTKMEVTLSMFFLKNYVYMKRLLPIVLFPAFLLLLPQSVRAQADSIEVSPYVGYNSAAGYKIDFAKAIEIGYDPEEDDGSEIASAQGGFVLGVGANFALSERESFDLRLRPSIEVAFVSGQSENYEGNFSDNTLSTDQQYLQLSGDVIAQFDRGAPYAPYAGAGLTIVRFSGSGEVTGLEEEDLDFSGTTVGLNLLGGVRFNDAVDFGIPYVQLRLALVDPRTDELKDLNAPSLIPAITLSGGISFGL